MAKKFGGTIKNWQLHTIVKGGTERFELLKEEFGDELMEDNMYIFTGTVVEDPLGRWQVGWSMRSSYVLNVDRENGIIETVNTIYKVEHEGDSYIDGDIGPAAASIYF